MLWYAGASNSAGNPTIASSEINKISAKITKIDVAESGIASVIQSTTAAPKIASIRLAGALRSPCGPISRTITNQPMATATPIVVRSTQVRRSVSRVCSRWSIVIKPTLQGCSRDTDHT